MTSINHPIDRVLRDAAERNQRVRAETQQAAINLERLIQLVVGTDEIPAEFKPRLIADRPQSEWRSDFTPVSVPPLPDEDTTVFSESTPQQTDPTTFAAASDTPPMDPQRLRPEDGGISLAYAAGDMLFAKGDPADIFFVVTEGRVSLFEPTTGFEMAVLGPGSSLGEQSILMGGVHSLSARAIDRVICTTVRADRLRTILDQQTGVVKPVFEAILLQLSMHNELRSQGNNLPL